MQYPKYPFAILIGDFWVVSFHRMDNKQIIVYPRLSINAHSRDVITRLVCYNW